MNQRILKDIQDIVDCDLTPFSVEVAVLEKIKSYDEYTYLHSLNVAKLSVMLGEKMGFDQEMLVDLAWAALLHDIGKLKVPHAVLNKLKSFSPEELSIMQSHPVESLTAFSEIEGIDIDKLRRLSAAFEHHQRFDLKGYPNVDRKLGLHPYSRIVAIADSFDAMTTDRIYQRRMTPDVALKIMSKGYGSVFDPVVLQAFITALGVYPADSIVRLNDGQLGIVLGYEEDAPIDRPIVKLIGEPGTKIDLSEGYEHLRIVATENPDEHPEILEQIKS